MNLLILQICDITTKLNIGVDKIIASSVVTLINQNYETYERQFGK